MSVTLRKIVFGVEQSKNLFVSTFRSNTTVKDLLNRAANQVSYAMSNQFICLNYAWLGNEVIPEGVMVGDIEFQPGEILFLTTRQTPPTAEKIKAARDSCECKLSETEPVKMALPQETVKTASPKKPAKKGGKTKKTGKKGTKGKKKAAGKAAPKAAETKPPEAPKGEPVLDEGEDEDDFNSLMKTNVDFRPSDLGMKMRRVDSKASCKGSWMVFTTVNYDSIIDGVEMELEAENTAEVVRGKVMEYVREQDPKWQKEAFKVQLYLVGGIEFSEGRLGDLYNVDEFSKAPRVVYAVVMRDIPDDVLKAECKELCDCAGNSKDLFSPVCGYRDSQLAQVACLLGYLRRNGKLSDAFLRTMGVVTGFAPLISSVYRVIANGPVIGMDIVAITSSLHAFYRALLSSTRDEDVFEFVLRATCYVVHGLPNEQRNVEFPMKTRKWELELAKGDRFRKFCEASHQRAILYQWMGDWQTPWPKFTQHPESPVVIEDAFKQMASFKPIAPHLLRLATGCIFVAGPNQYPVLYVGRTPKKDDNDDDQVDILDPLTGETKSYGMDSLPTPSMDETGPVLIDKEEVGQLVEVCVDTSNSMQYTLSKEHVSERSKKAKDGTVPKKGQKDQPHNKRPEIVPGRLRRWQIAEQYLNLFASRLTAFRIPSLQGLITFNDKIEELLPLSSNLSEFQNKVKTFTTNAGTRLWDAIDEAANNLIAEFYDVRTTPRVQKYAYARMRILVISDGDDRRSEQMDYKLVEKLVSSRIIVDAIVLNTKDLDECKTLAVLCHMTGGVAIRPETVEEGFSIIERESFLMLDCRKSMPMTKGPFTPEYIREAEQSVVFDKEIPNFRVVQAIRAQNDALVTPRQTVCNIRTDGLETHRKRILTELYTAALTQEADIITAERPDGQKVVLNDKDIRIYTKKGDYEQWRVFLKGPDDTPYADKWWSLVVTFPRGYPYCSPVVRFLSVPYHLNVSDEGRIGVDIIERKYVPSMSVVQILKSIRGILAAPNSAAAISREKLRVFTENPDEYWEKVRESTKNAKDSLDAWTAGVTISDNIKPGFKLSPSMVSEAYLMQAPTEAQFNHRC